MESRHVDVSESARKTTTFLLATFLWFHALTFLNPQSSFIAKCARLLRLTPSEVILVALIVIFSFVAGSGFWKSFLSLVYIYAFPIVLLGYVFYWLVLALRALNRWFKVEANPQLAVVQAIESKPSPPAPVPATSATSTVKVNRGTELLRFLLRPFQRFMLLWCILLLVATHKVVVWLSFSVVLIHLARKIFGILKILLFSDPWLNKLGKFILMGLETVIAGVAAVTPDVAPTSEMRNLWNQVNLCRKIINFFGDSYLVSRWAWVLGILFLGTVYIYMAFIFSFAYYGIARVSGFSYAWSDALLTSLFIPFFVTDLPRIFALRFLGGVHCLLVVGVSVGTFVNFLRRRLDSIHRTAREYNGRLSGQSIHEKYLILEGKFSANSPDSSAATEVKK